MEDYYKVKKVRKRIADLLERERYKLCLTQSQMAQKLDMSYDTYKKLVSVKNNLGISVSTIAKILENSNITHDDIFDGIYENKKK